MARVNGPEAPASRAQPQQGFHGEQHRQCGAQDVGGGDEGKVAHGKASVSEAARAISNARVRRSMTAALMRARLKAANSRV